MKRFKPLMDFKGDSFLSTIIAKLSTVTDSVYIVTGFRSDEISEYVASAGLRSDNIKLVRNRNYDRGMLTSLKAGISALEHTDWILYHFVDQPHLPLSFYQGFRSQINETKTWIQPRYQNKNGHPILINKALFKPITGLPDTASLRTLDQSVSFRKTFWDCPYPHILKDFDTPSDVLSAEIENMK